ncbi:hypothetical protein LP421_32680 (plasmid) [Rhizobium sp. RCAM05350]|nr:hypothetical protein LP421_32680 [Rhizobium sp. RCAM05350]
MLVAYLATGAFADIPREKAAEFLWGNEDRALAFTNLRKLISRLRVAHASILTFSATHLSLNRSDLVCDTDLLGEIRRGENPLSSLVDLMSRPFLSELDDADGMAGYWLKEQRQKQFELLRATA